VSLYFDNSLIISSTVIIFVMLSAIEVVDCFVFLIPFYCLCLL
jgi:hypothetical protein